jgi:hypothetical protein
MELTLNLVWVCVAIAGILVQIVMLSRAGGYADRPSNHCQKILAMICALVILFFVISMTDDLHDQTLLIEERRISRMAAGADIPAHPASTRWIPIGLLLHFSPVAFMPPLPAERRLVERSESLFVPAIEGESLCGRAPPNSPA